VYGINIFPKKFSIAAYRIIIRSRSLVHPLWIST
jgi:hypothetical protein